MEPTTAPNMTGDARSRLDRWRTMSAAAELGPNARAALSAPLTGNKRRKVLLAVGIFLDCERPDPSITEIAARTRLPRGAVVSIVDGLEAAGLLAIHRGNCAAGERNAYSFPRPEDEDVNLAADSGAVHLDADSVERVARRVVELLGEERADSGAVELLNTAEVARRFGVTCSYVYSHAEELGAIRLGDGPRARLRFDPAIVAERLSACSLSKGSASAESRTAKPKTPRRRRRLSGAEPILLPITPIRGTERSTDAPTDRRQL